MLEIIVPGKYTPRQIDRAETRRMEFKPSRYTSGSANLDDMIALGKAVILCETHARRFQPRKARYRAHPDRNLRRVRGNCDVCRRFDLAFLFLNERDALGEQRKLERYRRAAEYARLFTG